MHERLLGRSTPSYLAQLEQTQWLSREALRELQTRKLRALLTHAALNCPYYRDTITAQRIDPHSATLTDLGRMPTLTKEIIRREMPRMTETPARRRMFDYSTGGSSGDPLLFKIDRSRQAADQAARARSRRWFGVDLGERELYLWGAAVELAAQDRVKRLRDRLTNQRLLNAFEMTPSRMSRYLREIERFDPVHIFGYPSSLARLVRHGRDIGFLPKTRSLRAVFATGEVFAPQDRAIIEEAFGVAVADGYGSREAGFIAHQCPAGRYHVTMESVIVELLGEDGAPVTDYAPGEITVTHLDAFGMPFIRYRTGDIARRAAGACPCGRGLETIELIEGRRTDMLRTANGGWAHALSVIYVIREERSIREFRIEQQGNLDLVVSLVVDDGFDKGAENRVRQGLHKRLGAGPAILIRRVDRIAAAASGKHRCVVSHAQNETRCSDLSGDAKPG